MNQGDDADEELQLAFKRSLEGHPSLPVTSGEAISEKVQATRSVIPAGGEDNRPGPLGPPPSAKRSKSVEDLPPSQAFSPPFANSAGSEPETSSHHHRQHPAAGGKVPPGGSSHVSIQVASLAAPETNGERERRLQRELRAAAAERRLGRLQQPGSATSAPAERSQGATSASESAVQAGTSLPATTSAAAGPGHTGGPAGSAGQKDLVRDATSAPDASLARGGQAPLQGTSITQPSLEITARLVEVVFGPDPPPQTLSQWSNQGFVFSDDDCTSLGLVQREGGPCGVLAPVQALVLKYLLFEYPKTDAEKSVASALVFNDTIRKQALADAMAETLWLAGGESNAVLVTAALVPEASALSNPAKLQDMLRVAEFRTWEGLVRGVRESLALFESGIGALLLLFSVLLSRSLDKVQGDRDDPEPPLVTKPFGHASQEIVNLLLCGHAVPNVFDGVMDLGGGMALKGIPGQVEVGFLSLLESLNLCKVGGWLKQPKLPIWVVGSESHYTVLFALDERVQADEGGELGQQEKRIREAFDGLDTSGGGGFITAEGLDRLSSDMKFELPVPVKDELMSAMGVVVWNELWQELLKLDAEKGGFKALAEASKVPRENKKFILFHFNGIAKRVVGQSSTAPLDLGQPKERPRLTKIWVKVPPKWTPESMAIQPYTDLTLGEPASIGPGGNEAHMIDDVLESTSHRIESVKHAPLADCIRTRWPRATCDWDGEAPSIV